MVVSEESRRKMSESAKGHPNRNVLLRGCFKKGFTPWNKGIKTGKGGNTKPRSEETRRKLALASIGKPAWNKGIRGPLSHSWKDGSSSLTYRVRSSDEYYQWRADVFKRDGWTCQTCGLRGHGRDIEAHHIVPLHKILKESRIKGITDADQYLLAMAHHLIFDISNGITLCKNCHILTFKGERK